MSLRSSPPCASLERGRGRRWQRASAPMVTMFQNPIPERQDGGNEPHPDHRPISATLGLCAHFEALPNRSESSIHAIKARAMIHVKHAVYLR